MDWDHKEITTLRSLVADIRKESFKHFIDPTLFSLAFQCLCRMPMTNSKTILKFLEIIQGMIHANQDYSFLLKVGILAGKFPDYFRHKQQKAGSFRICKEVEVANAKLTDLQKRLMLNETESYISNGILTIQIDFRHIKQLRNVFFSDLEISSKIKKYKNCWKFLVDDEKKIAHQLAPVELMNLAGNEFEERWVSVLDAIRRKKCTQLKLLLKDDRQKWKIFHPDVNDLSGLSIAIIPSDIAQDFSTRKIAIKNPYDGNGIFTNLLGFQNIISYSENEAEYFTFISIYQKTVWEKSPWGVTELLKQFFERRTGNEPDAREMDTLRQRYYRFIKKTYPQDMQSLATNNEQNFPQYHIIGLQRESSPYDFYFYQRRKGTGAIQTQGDTAEYQARLRYDKKNKHFFLMPSSILSKKIEKNDDKGIQYFFQACQQHKYITKVEDVGYRVIKKIKVHSPSQAAWLVCGYKRNGWDAWIRRSADGTDFISLRSFFNHIKKEKSRSKKRTTQNAR